MLYLRSWTHAQVEEFAAATSAFDIEITPASAMKEEGDPPVNPLTALPEELVANTMYVVCTAVSDSPIFQFLHHKTLLCHWLNDVIAHAEVKPARLAAVPTYDEPRVSDEPLDTPRWPNLVVKLANSDEGKDVLMGRFETEEQARRVLGLAEDRQALPRPFKSRFDRYWIDRLFPGALSAVYQRFVPPEVVDGFPRMLRMELFISPLADTFLSAHGTVGGEKLWDCAPSGVLLQNSPYNVSVPPGRFVRLDQEIEEELKEVASEFGALARRALENKFSVRPCREARLLDPTGHETGD